MFSFSHIMTVKWHQSGLDLNVLLFCSTGECKSTQAHCKNMPMTTFLKKKKNDIALFLANFTALSM